MPRPERDFWKRRTLALTLSLVVMLTTLFLLGNSKNQGDDVALGNPQSLWVCPEGPPICEFSSIAEAIAGANPNDRIFIQPGIYEETLVVDKSIQLIGQGNGEIRIQGADPGKPTLSLRPEEKAAILLEGVTLLEGPPAGFQGDDPTGRCLRFLEICPNALEIAAQSSLSLALWRVRLIEGSLTCSTPQGEVEGSIFVSLLESELNHSTIAWGCSGPPSRLNLRRVRIWGNDSNGILIFADGIQLQIAESTFVGNRIGLEISGDNNSVVVQGSQFLFHSRAGMVLKPTANSIVEVWDSSLIGNDIAIAWGPTAFPGARIETHGNALRVEDSLFVGNFSYGLYVSMADPVEIQRSTFQNNGYGAVLFRADRGIEFIDTNIFGSLRWGIALYRAECGIEASESLLRLAAQQRVVILGEGNKMGANELGDLCPHSFPWPERFIAPDDD